VHEAVARYLQWPIYRHEGEPASYPLGTESTIFQG
jgi:hypothetical protein